MQRTTEVQGIRRYLSTGNETWRRGFQAAISTCLLAILLNWSAGFIMGQDTGALPSWDEMLDTIVAGMRSNRENLGLVKLTMTTELTNPHVERNRVVRQEMPDGMVLHMTETRHSKSSRSVFLLDSRLRHDRLDSSGQIAGTSVFDGNNWISYAAGRQTADIQSPENRGSAMPPDPFEILSLQDSHRPLEVVLREGEFQEARAVRGPDGQIRWVVRLLVPGRVTLNHEFEFAPDQRFLPVRSQAFHKDGSVYLAATVKYRLIPERDAWVPEAIQNTVFPPGRARSLESGGWNSRMDHQVLEVALLDSSEADRVFSVPFAEGTIVRDQPNQRIYRVGGAPARVRFWSPYVWVGVAACACILVFVVLNLAKWRTGVAR